MIVESLRKVIFHTPKTLVWVLGMGLGFYPKPKKIGFGFLGKKQNILGNLGIGIGYIPKPKNPQRDFLGVNV